MEESEEKRMDGKGGKKGQGKERRRMGKGTLYGVSLLID